MTDIEKLTDEQTRGVLECTWIARSPWARTVGRMIVIIGQLTEALAAAESQNRRSALDWIVFKAERASENDSLRRAEARVRELEIDRDEWRTQLAAAEEALDNEHRRAEHHQGAAEALREALGRARAELAETIRQRDDAHRDIRKLTEELAALSVPAPDYAEVLDREIGARMAAEARVRELEAAWLTKPQRGKSLAPVVAQLAAANALLERVAAINTADLPMSIVYLVADTLHHLSAQPAAPECANTEAFLSGENTGCDGVDCPVHTHGRTAAPTVYHRVGCDARDGLPCTHRCDGMVTDHDRAVLEAMAAVPSESLRHVAIHEHISTSLSALAKPCGAELARREAKR